MSDIENLFFMPGALRVISILWTNRFTNDILLCEKHAGNLAMLKTDVCVRVCQNKTYSKSN